MKPIFEKLLAELPLLGHDLKKTCKIMQNDKPHGSICRKSVCGFAHKEMRQYGLERGFGEIKN